MGFDVGRTVYKLTFDEPHLAGFEVSIAAMSVAEMFAYNDSITEARDGDTRFRLMVDAIGRQLVAWNAERDGQPVPATRDELLKLDDHYVSPIIAGWLRAVRPAEQADPTRLADPIEPGPPMQPVTEVNGNELVPAG